MLNETSRNVVVVMNSIALTTVVEFEKIGGSESPSSSRVRTQRVPLPPLKVVRLGLKPNKCSATTAIEKRFLCDR